jgi:hypothetical protein
MTSIIMSAPWIESESPYTLVCDANICGDAIILKFVGHGARAHSVAIRSMRKGDVVVLKGKVMRNEMLVEYINVVNKADFKGRNLNTHM